MKRNVEKTPIIDIIPNRVSSDFVDAVCAKTREYQETGYPVPTPKIFIISLP